MSVVSSFPSVTTLSREASVMQCRMGGRGAPKILPLATPGAADAWVRTHIGGMLIMLVTLLLPVVGFDAKGARRVNWMLVGTGWASIVFYSAAVFAPNRALPVLLARQVFR